MRTETGLHLKRGGAGHPTLLLLHGLGAVGEVWQGLEEILADRWPGTWVIPDLPGHGRSAEAMTYSFGGMTAQIAEGLGDDGPLVVLGHSLGGVLALTLATGWFGVPVAATCGLGIKVQWSPEELAKAAEVAAKPARTFATREQAAERWLKVAGLSGLWAPMTPHVAAGLIDTDDGWRTALDPRAFGIGAPDLPGLLAASRAKVVLAAGEKDPMCSSADLRVLQPDAVVLPGLGHNAHVEDPAALWPVLESLLAAV
jgi:pimeloyl-ACP methyl ester carboxylesterase